MSGISVPVEYHEKCKCVGKNVLKTVIPRNVSLAEAPSHGSSIIDYDRASKGSMSYLALAGEIVKISK